MTKNSQFYNLEEILAGYVLGDLDEQELLWLNKQLAANPQLKKQVSQLESTLNLIPYGLPDNFPDSDLRSQILIQAQSQQAYPKHRWSRILSAVATASALLLGINNFGLRQKVALTEARLQQQQELISLLRQPNNRLVALKANDDAVTTSGSLFISPASNTAVLTLKNLDNLPEKQVYRLWAVSQDRKIGCSDFTPNAKGEVYLNLSSGDVLFHASSISITIEPKPDTEQPLGREFLSGSHSEI